MRLTLGNDPDDRDQVGRQRRKRAMALRSRPVANFNDVTLDDVLRSVLAATEESDGQLDVERFLTERGHAWQTVEMVNVCLRSVDVHVPSPLPPTGM